VLGSILSGLEAIVNVIGMAKMTPPIRDLLPRLTPILRNRHEKVQESVVSLVGRIADRGAEHVHAKEWMRICFELLELLKAPKKAIRRAAVSTFGYISRGIGPQDVLHTLLNNLKVQDRQNRVCTTVAIAIVAESCGPFTVLPAIMNECVRERQEPASEQSQRERGKRGVGGGVSVCGGSGLRAQRRRVHLRRKRAASLGGCRGGTPRTPPAAGDVAHALGRAMRSAARSCARPHMRLAARTCVRPHVRLANFHLRSLASPRFAHLASPRSPRSRAGTGWRSSTSRTAR
jgi:hypothetical protein